ncbi:MAG TPA: GerMN domain-containing protein [bacterium]|nr:GerMN domain-containing protein [bacterium]HPT29632.1 GerMN domain-containing protein [bacterium]
MKKIILVIVLVLLLLAFMFCWLRQEKKQVREDYQPIPLNKELRDEIKVFFGNSKLNPEAADCSLSYGVKRSIAAKSPKYDIAIRELLIGPTGIEKNAGYYTSLNATVTPPQIKFVDGTITLDFKSDFETGMGGSCRVAAVRSQIVNTLKQFPEVKEVVIAVNGNSAEALQP